MRNTLQPLDAELFGPLKVVYLQEVENWLFINPGKAVSQRHVTTFFFEAYTRKATIEKTENNFMATGIFPRRPFIISNEYFEPSDTTCRYEMPDGTLEETEDKHSHKDSPLPVSDADLLTSVSTQTPGNVHMESNNTRKHSPYESKSSHPITVPCCQ
jgi:hypothetical protein